MTRIRHIALVLSIALAATLLPASVANATSIALSAPVMRSGARVGTAYGSLVLGHNGFAIVNVRVLGFRAPTANRSWRTRTTLVTSCVEPGFDPAFDDPADFDTTAVRVSSPWKTTRITGMTGTLRTTDFVEECPAGQGPGSSLQLTLLAQDSTGTTRVAFANLFSAG